MSHPKQLLSLGAILLAAAIVSISSGARGKEDSEDKRPAGEKRSLMDEFSSTSQPVGRILGARVNEPNKSLNLWNVEVVAATGITLRRKRRN
jgi:hypothetical protein